MPAAPMNVTVDVVSPGVVLVGNSVTLTISGVDLSLPSTSSVCYFSDSNGFVNAAVTNSSVISCTKTFQTSGVISMIVGVFDVAPVNSSATSIFVLGELCVDFLLFSVESALTRFWY